MSDKPLFEESPLPSHSMVVEGVAGTGRALTARVLVPCFEVSAEGRCSLLEDASRLLLRFHVVFKHSAFA